MPRPAPRGLRRLRAPPRRSRIRCRAPGVVLPSMSWISDSCTRIRACTARRPAAAATRRALRQDRVRLFQVAAGTAIARAGGASRRAAAGRPGRWPARVPASPVPPGGTRGPASTRPAPGPAAAQSHRLATVTSPARHGSCHARGTRPPGLVPARPVKERPGVPPPGLSGVARLGQPAGGVLADGLQHPVPGPGPAVSARTRDLLTSRSTTSRAAAGPRRSTPRRLRQAKPAGEHRQLAEGTLLRGGQQVIAPVDRRPQRLVPRIGGRPPVGQEPELVRQVRLDLLHRQHAGPRRRQLDRQRQAVQLPADPADHRHR